MEKNLPTAHCKLAEFIEREHLPEEGGAFKYHLGIIIDGKLISAPVILQEINDRGIIENFEPAQVDPLIERMKASIAAKKP